MKSKLFKSTLVGACLVAGCAVAPTATTQLSGDEAAVLNSTAVSARYQLMQADGPEADAGTKLTATVTASSVRNEYFRLAYLTDGRLNTAWGPMASDEAPTLTFDLKGCYDLTGMSVKQSGGATFDVAVMDEDGVWTTVAEDVTTEAAALDWVEVAASGATQVRLTFSGDTDGLLVCDVSWYGTPCGGGGGPLPSPSPTATPSASPTATPTTTPTTTPSETPSESPTPVPTATPTVAPTATPTVAPTPPVEEDCGCKVTGGGFTFLPDGSRVNFGFNAQHDKDGDAKGNINVQVRGPGGFHFKSDTITDVDCDIDPTSVAPKLTGTVTVTGTVQGSGETFTLVLVDDGEPGVLDDIKLSIGGTVVFDGELGGEGSGGGNIQIHKEKCD